MHTLLTEITCINLVQTYGVAFADVVSHRKGGGEELLGQMVSAFCLFQIQSLIPDPTPPPTPGEYFL